MSPNVIHDEFSQLKTAPQRYRRRHLRDGLCATCSNKPFEKSIYCALCLVKRKGYQKTYYSKQKNKIV